MRLGLRSSGLAGIRGVCVAVLVGACVVVAGGVAPPAHAARARSSDAASAPSARAARSGPDYTKIMVIAEENKSYGQIIGNADAPYLNQLADQYGLATHYRAGYPVRCPSLAGYLLMTGGSRHGICDDKGPRAHQLRGANIFSQAAHRKNRWRVYAESMPKRCYRHNAKKAGYLVRHTAAPYYRSERKRCGRWQLPMGGLTSGKLHHKVVNGTLPAYSLVVPNVCHEMHGGPACDQDANLVAEADAWLSRWVPMILDGGDYQHGRLVVVITFDEGSETSNRIPTIVISPTTRGIRVTKDLTHCSLARTTAQILRAKPLRCAKHWPSMVDPFDLR